MNPVGSGVGIARDFVRVGLLATCGLVSGCTDVGDSSVAPGNAPPASSADASMQGLLGNGTQTGPTGDGAADAATSVSATIGSAGGTVRFDGVTLTIPPDALSTSVTIGIALTPFGPPNGVTNLTPVFDFTPESQTFSSPVTVAFDLVTATSSSANPVILWSTTTGYEQLATSAPVTPAAPSPSNPWVVSGNIVQLGRGFCADGSTVTTIPFAPVIEAGAADATTEATNNQVVDDAESDSTQSTADSAIADAATDASSDANTSMSNGFAEPAAEVTACNDHLAAVAAAAADAGGVPDNAVGATCSETEVLAFEKDNSGSCLDCLLQSGCLDDTVGDMTQECEDFGDAGPGKNACLSVLACDLGVAGYPTVVPSPASGNPIAAFCGDASSTACQLDPMGPCTAVITAGFPAGDTPAQIINAISATVAQDPAGGGLGSRIVLCGINNSCNTCTQ